MSDGWLYAVIVVMAVLVLLACIMLVAYFGHPDDTNQAWFPRIVVISGLFIALSSILCLPYDVAVHSDDANISSGIRTDVLWQVIYFVIAGYIGLIIPYAFFYYESDTDPDVKFCEKQWVEALKSTLAFFVTMVVILVIMYAFLNVAELGVNRIALSPGVMVPINSTSFPNNALCNPKYCVEDQFTLDLDITFPVYVIAFIAFLGWWFFTLFVGVGFIALPLDLFNEFKTRPEPMSLAEYTSRKKELGQRASLLVEAGESILKDIDNPNASRKQSRATDNSFKKFEQAYYFIKTDYDTLQISFQLKGGNPLWYFFKLFLGIVGGCLSILWIIHICIFVLPSRPIHPFLNEFFIDLDFSGFPLFGVIAFSIFAFYLIWACIKGAFKLGIRFVIFQIYPMELHKTLMNAFLANTWVIMVCCVPTVQFCVQCFPAYTRLTSVDMLFGTQVQHLEFFRYFFENAVFIYMILVMSFLTFVYLTVSPRDKGKEIEKKIAKVARGEDDDD